MGLDNGISIRRNEKSMSIYDKLKRFEDDWDKEHRYDFELAYWRKCWNVRDMIADSIGGIYDNSKTFINRENLIAIIFALKSLNAENWDEDYSIWTWEEQEPHIKRYIENLEYLYQLMGEYDLDIYFYDSY